MRRTSSGDRSLLDYWKDMAARPPNLISRAYRRLPAVPDVRLDQNRVRSPASSVVNYL